MTNARVALWFEKLLLPVLVTASAVSLILGMTAVGPKAYVLFLQAVVLMACGLYLYWAHTEHQTPQPLEDEEPDELLDVWFAYVHPNGSSVVEDVNGTVVASFSDHSMAQHICQLRNTVNDLKLALVMERQLEISAPGQEK